MQGSFTKGLLLGSIVGASMSYVMNNDMMTSNRNRRRMFRTGKNFLRKSGHLIGDVVSLFR
jgi:hypothetical protein